MSSRAQTPLAGVLVVLLCLLALQIGRHAVFSQHEHLTFGDSAIPLLLLAGFLFCHHKQGLSLLPKASPPSPLIRTRCLSTQTSAPSALLRLLLIGGGLPKLAVCCVCPSNFPYCDSQSGLCYESASKFDFNDGSMNNCGTWMGVIGGERCSSSYVTPSPPGTGQAADGTSGTPGTGHAADEDTGSGSTIVIVIVVIVALGGLLFAAYYCRPTTATSGEITLSSGLAESEVSAAAVELSEKTAVEYDVFVSFRISEAESEAHKLQRALEAKGVTTFVSGKQKPGESLPDVILGALEVANVVVIMGTKTYGKETGPVYSSKQEMILTMDYVKQGKKQMYLFKMCNQWEEMSAKAVFSDKKYREWMPSTPIPDGAVDEIAKMLE